MSPACEASLLQEADRLQTEVGIGARTGQIRSVLKSLRKADVIHHDIQQRSVEFIIFDYTETQSHRIERARKKSLVADRFEIRHFVVVLHPLSWCVNKEFCFKYLVMGVIEISFQGTIRAVLM